MKANRKFKEAQEGFMFIVPMTMAIVVGIAVLAVGIFVVGEITSALESTLPTNRASGSIDFTHWHNATTTNTTRNVTLTCTAGELSGSITRFYILANGSAVYYNLTVNGNPTNRTSYLAMGVGYNHTLTALIASTNVSSSDEYLNFTWNVSANKNRIYIRAYGTYFISSDYRSSNQNMSVNLLGNLTDGFADIVDIEIVVIIITALSMAIFAILAVGTKPRV